MLVDQRSLSVDLFLWRVTASAALTHSSAIIPQKIHLRVIKIRYATGSLYLVGLLLWILLPRCHPLPLN